MEGFQCLGPSCEDNCCGGWRISVDQGHHAKLRKLMSRTPEEQALFARTFSLMPPADRSRDHFAQIALGEDGLCPLLLEGGLCSLHHRHGESALPHTCSSYPRTVNRVGDRLELSGALSCPEVARRALLHEGATDIVESTPAGLGRGLVLQDNVADIKNGYARHLDEIRGTMYSLSRRDDFPVRSRLYFMATLALRTDALFHADGDRFDQAALEAELDNMAQDDVLADLHRQLGVHIQAQAGAVDPFVIALVMEVLGRRLQVTSRRVFCAVVEEVMASFAAEAGSGVLATAASEVSLEPALLAQAYRPRRDRVTAAFEARLDLYLRAYCSLFWFKDWYMQSASLQRHMLSLLMRLCVLRFLLLGHPAAQEAAEAGDAAALDQVAVRVFYSFSRAVEHSPGFLGGVSQYLDRHLTSLGPALGMISF
jgi:lysine-N-methylase